MVAGILAIAIGAQATQATPRKVEGLLVASIDKGFLAKVDKQYLPGEPIVQLRSKFNEARYLIAEWGRRSAILIDRDLPLIKKTSDEIAVLKAITRTIKRDLTIDPEDLSVEERISLKQFLGRFLPDWGGDRLDQARLGLSFSTIFTVRGSDGRSFTSHRSRKNESTQARDAALQRKPYDSDPGKLSKDEIAKRFQILKDRDFASRSISFQCFGIADQNLPEGLAETRKVLDKLILELLTEKQTQALELAKKAGLPRTTGDGEVPLASLNPEQRDEALMSFLELSGLNGFKDANDARQYYDGVSSIRIGTSLGICFCTRPGDGEFKPPVYWGFEIGSFYGSPP